MEDLEDDDSPRHRSADLRCPPDPARSRALPASLAALARLSF
jgi:hypothetical protein